jgi:signal transduction histidine kinase
VNEHLDAATREVDRLAEMVDELLVLSRAGERELPGDWQDLGEAAARAVERWRPIAVEAGIDLTGSVAAPSRAWCAEADLDRALDALVENAIRYSPRDTAVEIQARDGAIDVIDEGPGLEPGEEEDVFERFHRGRAGRRGAAGTGLGLPIARELAREWGGSVTLAVRPQGGARATLELPPTSSES